MNDRVESRVSNIPSLEFCAMDVKENFVNSIGVSERRVVFEVRDLVSRSKRVWDGEGNKMPRGVESFEVLGRVLFTLAGSFWSLWRDKRVLIG